MFHYKFAGDWLGKLRDYVIDRYGAIDEYNQIMAECKGSSKGFSLKRDTAKRYDDIDKLIDEEFLTISKQYFDFINDEK